MLRKGQQQMAASREIWFTSYLKMDFLRSGRYRMMVLGSLPHILVFLGVLYTGAQDSRVKTKKRTRLPLKSEELDSLDKQLTRINAALKIIIKWKKSLDPQSDFHVRHDCLELQSIIKEIEEFIQNDLAELPIALSPETRAEFDMGFKGIAYRQSRPTESHRNWTSP
ncbi:hypothetical protein BDP27DRAFT_1333366 [Rhodocollybia butyracea]|uniref:Uncharacterized protein n=1 Tax=Rhodocollybia butyracea TaxID=206335 RepID=A0A9P5PM42_9AGAR|nr:hypothetical protein BDP27DRAFT_1333366 [Rhodocollybia butyracea]